MCPLDNVNSWRQNCSEEKLRELTTGQSATWKAQRMKTPMYPPTYCRPDRLQLEKLREWTPSMYLPTYCRPDRLQLEKLREWTTPMYPPTYCRPDRLQLEKLREWTTPMYPPTYCRPDRLQLEKLREWTTPMYPPTYCRPDRLQLEKLREWTTSMLTPGYCWRQTATEKSSENGQPGADDTDCNQKTFSVCCRLLPIGHGRLQKTKVQRMDQSQCALRPTADDTETATEKSSETGPTSVCSLANFKFREWINVDVLTGLL